MSRRKDSADGRSRPSPSARQRGGAAVEPELVVDADRDGARDLIVTAPSPRSVVRRSELPRSHRRSSRVPPPRAATAEEMLERAMHAKTPRARAIWARRGLALRGRIDRTTQSMLLRQIYLAYYEARSFARAFAVSEQILALGVLRDVALQDSARALQGMGDVDRAAGQLRLAAREAPARRKAFHWWTLGSLYFLAGRYDEAASALERAARWGTTDKPLYQGHLALTRCARGERVVELAHLIERLEEVPAGQGYGRFVLGQMAYYDKRWDQAQRYLEAFVRRSTSGRPAMTIALDGEIAVARRTLAHLKGVGS